MSSSILSARNVTLFVFILVVLFLGATFNVQVGPESFEGPAPGPAINVRPSATNGPAPAIH